MEVVRVEKNATGLLRQRSCNGTLSATGHTHDNVKVHIQVFLAKSRCITHTDSLMAEGNSLTLERKRLTT